MCCKAIYLGLTVSRIKEIAEEKGADPNGDAAFVYKNWQPMSDEDAYEINPHLRTWGLARGEKGFTFFRCTKFDPETNKCTIHDETVRVCNAYPWYDTGVRPNECFYSPDCGYKIDVEQFTTLDGDALIEPKTTEED
jgi:Fe-S-cluster containining protein